MPEEPKDSDSSSIAKGREASKVLAGAVVVLYVVGFLVVTFHLAQFGFVPVSWLRPQYLLAGIWCLLPSLLLIWIVAYGTGQSLTLLDKTHSPRPSKVRKYHYVVVVFLIAAGFATAMQAGFTIVELVLGQPLTFKLWGHQTVIALKIGGFYLAAVVTGVPGVMMMTEAIKSPKQLSIDFVSQCCTASLLLCFALAMGVGYVRYFSTTVYPVIPSAIGGGRPQGVVFLLDKEHGEPPVTADSSGARSVPYQLLLKTETTYVVQSQKAGEKAIEFRQERVKGMVTLDH